MAQGWPSRVAARTGPRPSCLARGLYSVKTCVARGSQQAYSVLREADRTTVTSVRPSVSWGRTEVSSSAGVLRALRESVELLSTVKAGSGGVKQLKIKIRGKVNGKFTLNLTLVCISGSVAEWTRSHAGRT